MDSRITAAKAAENIAFAVKGAHVADNITTILEKPGDHYIIYRLGKEGPSKMFYKALDNSIKVADLTDESKNIVKRIKEEQARRELEEEYLLKFRGIYPDYIKDKMEVQNA